MGFHGFGLNKTSFSWLHPQVLHHQCLQTFRRQGRLWFEDVVAGFLSHSYPWNYLVTKDAQLCSVASIARSPRVCQPPIVLWVSTALDFHLVCSHPRITNHQFHLSLSILSSSIFCIFPSNLIPSVPTTTCQRSPENLFDFPFAGQSVHPVENFLCYVAFWRPWVVA